MLLPRGRMKHLLALAIATSMLGGCYLGRSSERKLIAYSANVGLVAVGVAGIAGAGGDEAGILTTISLIPLVAGVAGILINVAAGAPPSSSRSRAPQAGPAPASAAARPSAGSPPTWTASSPSE